MFSYLFVNYYFSIYQNFWGIFVSNFSFVVFFFFDLLFEKSTTREFYSSYHLYLNLNIFSGETLFELRI